MTTLTTPRTSYPATTPPQQAALESACLTHENRNLLHGIDWATYLRLRHHEDNHALRMTYDSGRLEIMLPSRLHERANWLLGRFIECWFEELDLPLDAGGSTTYMLEGLEKGLEPDNCYYIQNEAAVRGKDQIDLTIDPPPDLAVEVEVSSPLLSKLPVYAAIRVPEIWHWRNGQIHVLLLNADGNYAESSESRCLPGFPLTEAARLIELRHDLDVMSLLREFRKWVRQYRSPDAPSGG